MPPPQITLEPTVRQILLRLVPMLAASAVLFHYYERSKFLEFGATALLTAGIVLYHACIFFVLRERVIASPDGFTILRRGEAQHFRWDNIDGKFETFIPRSGNSHCVGFNLKGNKGEGRFSHRLPQMLGRPAGDVARLMNLFIDEESKRSLF
jgi:hypothetical protein